MVKRKDVPVLLTIAAAGVGVGIGMWLMRDRISKVARDIGASSKRLQDNPLDVFGADAPDEAFEGVANFPHIPEGFRPKRRVRS
jgi:hypothetical protein